MIRSAKNHSIAVVLLSLNNPEVKAARFSAASQLAEQAGKYR